MAHSIQTLGGSSTSLDDLDLLAVVSLLAEESERPQYMALRSAVRAWQAELVGYGPGVIDLKLEALAPAARHELTTALSILETTLGATGFTSGAVLNGRCTAPGVTFNNDYPVVPLLKAITALRGLVA
jgi:hypothetical protein